MDDLPSSPGMEPDAGLLDAHEELKLPDYTTSHFTTVLPIMDTSSIKRSFDDYVAVSSDPPLFSSDSLDPSVEHYAQPGRKRQHVGTWYDDHHDHGMTSSTSLSSKRKPRERGPFRRNFDSGIYLGSDDTVELPQDHESDSGGLIGIIPESSNLYELRRTDGVVVGRVESMSETGNDVLFNLAMETADGRDPMINEGHIFPYWQKQPEDLDMFHEVEAIAAGHIATCVEEGLETLDLSYVTCSLPRIWLSIESRSDFGHALTG